MDDVTEIAGLNIEKDDRLEELRHLLLQPEQQQLKALGERLEDPKQHARDVSQVLPEALLLSAKQSEKLSTALRPTVEEIIRASIKHNIRSFADMLFPVIGPAIRKAMSEVLKQMIQSLSQALDHSFSWQGMKWRLESVRSGRPFAEIVMLNSLVYRVEQVFLIHPESGLLLQHMAAEAEAFQDADLVSGMLTAIQDFVRDSFDVESGNALNTIQMGDFTIWLMQGPKAVIAGAIRGNAPEKLRQVFNDALENIHLEQGDALDEFAGDTTLLEPARRHLESCLQTRFKQKQRRFSPLLALSLLAVTVVLGLWLFDSIRDQRRWENYLQQLKAEPGIVVTEAGKRDGIYRVSGLRDPMAREPVEILATNPIEPDRVKHRFQPYQALSDDLVLLRAQRILASPATVLLSFDNGVLKARGTAPHAWISDTRRLARALPGVLAFDDAELSTEMDLSRLAAPESVALKVRDGLLTASGSAPYVWISAARELATQIPGIDRYADSDVIIEPDLSSLAPLNSVMLDLQGGILTARGSASSAWMAAARKKALHIPGITRYDDSSLQNLDLAELLSLKSELEQTVIHFGVYAIRQDNQQNGLGQLQSKVKRLLQLARILDSRAQILIVGHSDSSGRPQRNLELSRGRAEYVHNYLISNGVSSDYLTAWGVGTNEPVSEENSEQGKAMNRSVTFKIYLTDTAGGIQ